MQLQLLILSVLGMRLFAQAQVETVTLFDLASPTEPIVTQEFNNINITVLGVNSQGATTYVEEAVESHVVIVKDSTTQTITLSTPASVTITFGEDASKDVETIVPSVSGELAFGQTCTWGSDGNGECVADIRLPQQSTDVLDTWTGTKTPFTTLIVSLPATAAISSSTTPAVASTTTMSNYGSTLHLGGGAPLVRAMSSIAILQVVGGLMVLL